MTRGAGLYLGRRVDPATGDLLADEVQLDPDDLTTHAVVIGMTGSGKTGLCLSLLEELALQGIPALAVDPKGDLGNLLLTFPELSASDPDGRAETGGVRRRGGRPGRAPDRGGSHRGPPRTCSSRDPDPSRAARERLCAGGDLWRPLDPADPGLTAWALHGETPDRPFHSGGAMANSVRRASVDVRS